MPRSRPGPVSPLVAAQRVALGATLVGALAGALAACDAGARAPTDAPRGDPALADTLAAHVAAAYDFSRPDVATRLMDLYPATGPVVSAAAGRVTTSRQALQGEIERFWERVGQNMQGPRFVIGERHATRLGPDAAVLTLTYSIPHRTPEGRPHLLGGAWTAVFERRDGRWVIVQEHLSDVPRPVAAPAAPGDSAAARPAPDHSAHHDSAAR